MLQRDSFRDNNNTSSNTNNNNKKSNNHNNNNNNNNNDNNNTNNNDGDDDVPPHLSVAWVQHSRENFSPCTSVQNPKSTAGRFENGPPTHSPPPRLESKALKHKRPKALTKTP
ncbi:unnamed protein product [Polarella glacialis]|uniref:Uncharacterized protein n=1 Tax=Polarella glacialis TaxID=89957 RepID=A0A813LLS7_POLGL|nr:unnamed protein product [Polarella glacialis]